MRIALAEKGYVTNIVLADAVPKNGILLKDSDMVSIGWIYDGTHFSPPPPPPETPMSQEQLIRHAKSFALANLLEAHPLVDAVKSGKASTVDDLIKLAGNSK